MTRLVPVFLSLGSAALAAMTVSAPPSRGDAVDDLVRREMKSQHIPGMTVAVLRDGVLIKAEGYGLACVELGAPASKDTRYEIASVTKPFTAAAVLLLVEDGRVRLDDPLGKYVPAVPETWRRVTVRQLLNHTGGLPRDAFEINPTTERLEYTRRDILKLVSGMSLLFQPGERFEYSNLGYYLLGIVIEEAGGMPYADFLRTRIFRPLGMSATRVNDYRVVLPNRARGYEWQGQLRLGAYQSPSSYAPAGGIITTAVDLARWTAALSKRPFLKRDSLEQMYRPAKLAGGREFPYGLGWNLDRVRGRRDLNHRGSNAGFSSTVHRYEDEGLSVILLANLAGADLERVARGVVGCFVPELRPVSLIQARRDPHLAWTERLREGLSRLSQGRPHPVFSPEFVDEFKRFDQAKALAARLENLRSFSFLDSRTVEKWRGFRPGGAVHRLEYYRLVSGSRTQGYVFSVDARDRVLWLEIEEDPPQPSAMDPDADRAPAVTRSHQDLMLSWSTGRSNRAGMTGELERAFTDDVLRSFQRLLAGVTGLRFIASRDTRRDRLRRLGREVRSVRYYEVKRRGPALFMACYLAPNGELADVEFSWR